MTTKSGTLISRGLFSYGWKERLSSSIVLAAASTGLRRSIERTPAVMSVFWRLKSEIDTLKYYDGELLGCISPDNACRTSN